MNDPHVVTAILALAYATLAAIDGLWLHLWRYRLHHRAPAEHALHTARAVLFSAVVALLLMGWTHGLLLWCGLLIALADLGLVAWDAAMETRTRAFQRGLPPGEAALHTLLQALHAGLLVWAVTIRPWPVWSGVRMNEATPGPMAQLLLLVVLGGCVVVALIHVALLRPLRWPASSWGR